MTFMGRLQKSALDSPTAKTMAVLGAVARLANAPISLVAEDTGLPAPTVYRICEAKAAWLAGDVASYVAVMP
jgi:hypothetical protein